MKKKKNAGGRGGKLQSAFFGVKPWPDSGGGATKNPSRGKTTHQYKRRPGGIS